MEITPKKKPKYNSKNGDMRTEFVETTTAPVRTAEESGLQPRKPGLNEGRDASRYEIFVPMRVMDEWALLNFLEKTFGGDAFTVVVSETEMSPFLGTIADSVFAA